MDTYKMASATDWALDNGLEPVPPRDLDPETQRLWAEGLVFESKHFPKYSMEQMWEPAHVTRGVRKEVIYRCMKVLGRDMMRTTGGVTLLSCAGAELDRYVLNDPAVDRSTYMNMAPVALYRAMAYILGDQQGQLFQEINQSLITEFCSDVSLHQITALAEQFEKGLFGFGSPYTPVHWLHRYAMSLPPEVRDHVTEKAQRILILILADGRVRHFQPSRVAAAALAFTVGTDTADRASGYDLFDYTEVLGRTEDLAHFARSIQGDLDPALLNLL